MHKTPTEKELQQLKAKRSRHMVLSCILLTIVLSALIFFFPSGVMAAFCVIFVGIFFCLAVSYQKAVLNVLILCLGSLGVVACFFFIAQS